MNTHESAMLEYIKSTNPDAAIMSTVAANEFKYLVDYLNEACRFIRLDDHTGLPLINKYATPKTLGTDRIAGAIGAWILAGKNNVLLVDVGTCINYELVIDNMYLGGAISPGLQMRLRAMHEHTGRLPLLYLTDEEIPFTGDSTDTCMLSGAVHGAAEEVKGVIRNYEVRYPGIQVWLTGGDAAYLGKYLKNSIFALENNVVLTGLVEILKFNLDAEN